MNDKLISQVYNGVCYGAGSADSATAGSALCANANDGATSADVKSNRLTAPNGFNIFIPFL